MYSSNSSSVEDFYDEDSLADDEDVVDLTIDNSAQKGKTQKPDQFKEVEDNIVKIRKANGELIYRLTELFRPSQAAQEYYQSEYQQSSTKWYYRQRQRLPQLSEFYAETSEIQAHSDEHPSQLLHRTIENYEENYLQEQLSLLDSLDRQEPDLWNLLKPSNNPVRLTPKIQLPQTKTILPYKRPSSTYEFEMLQDWNCELPVKKAKFSVVREIVNTQACDISRTEERQELLYDRYNIEDEVELYNKGQNFKLQWHKKPKSPKFTSRKARSSPLTTRVVTPQAPIFKIKDAQSLFLTHKAKNKAPLPNKEYRNDTWIKMSLLSSNNPTYAEDFQRYSRPAIQVVTTEDVPVKLPEDTYDQSDSDTFSVATSKQSNLSKTEAPPPHNPKARLQHTRVAHDYAHLKDDSQRELAKYHRPSFKPLSSLYNDIYYINIPYQDPIIAEQPHSWMKFKSIRHLSVRRSRKFVLFEYIEERPNVLSNVGMANVLHHYTLGEPLRNPKYIGKLGFQVHTNIPTLANIEPNGQITMFENNMSMGPAFSHSSSKSDFLLVTGKTADDYWTIKRIPWLYTVGQIEPKMPVLQPRVRYSATTEQQRMRAYIFKHLSLNHNQITIYDICWKFKQARELFVRKLLKQENWMKNSEGFWQYNGNFDDLDIKEDFSPEHLCLYQSCQEYRCRLSEQGISTVSTSDKTGPAIAKFKEQTQDRKMHWIATHIGRQLDNAPWSLTQSYIDWLSLRGQHGILALDDAGDPTNGHGGISFNKQLYQGQNHIPQKERLTGLEIRELYQRRLDDSLRKQIKYFGLWKPRDLQIQEEEESEIGEYLDDEMEIEQKESSSNVKEDLGVLQQFIQEHVKNQNTPPTNETNKKKVYILKRRTIYENLDKSITEKIEYITDRKIIETFRINKDIEGAKMRQLRLAEDRASINFHKEEDVFLTDKKDQPKKRKGRKPNANGTTVKHLNNVAKPGAQIFGDQPNIVCGSCLNYGHRKNNRKLCPTWIELQPEPVIKCEQNGILRMSLKKAKPPSE